MIIRFRSFSDSQLQEMLDSLVEQQVSGVASISQNGETITFSTPEKIERAIQALEREITRREDAAAGRTRRRSYVSYPTGGKGWH
ncbi:hypothetical protein DLJ49_19980 [Rhodovulum sp. 12E13]|uniref:phage head-tail joining protein n=1 Tax=Rhodovulum sp. 12E13 TaxID=2203891 RepID=UPI000E116B60|nr:hypothetical protein [Rhodovulum sp. 12E13]RDC68490.1 hypothetical protein DLJ49_19980 [Rhodovulum sp. 12E13]